MTGLAERSVPPGYRLLLRVALIGGFAGFAAYYIAVSLGWPLLGDSPVMHYVNLLMRHGYAPYRDITDNNMPGAYLTESWAMHLFGSGDLGWRVYEYVLLLLLTAAMIAIAWPLDWLAGVFAAGLFLMQHGSEGPNFAVEREQVMAVLLMVGYASLFTALRRRQPGWMLPFGLATALAATIKPTLTPLAILLLVLAYGVLRRRSVAPGAYLGWALTGFAAVTAMFLGFLWHFHVFGQFLFLLRVITPSYVALNHPTVFQLLRRVYPRALLPLLPVYFALLAAGPRRWNWERWALLLGAAAGAFSYFAQGKGFLHHRYIFLCFLFLLFGLEFTAALRRRGWQRTAGAAALLYAVVVALPYYVHNLRQTVGSSDLTTALEGDLRSLGTGPAGAPPSVMLNDKVQCFDLVAGCLNTLLHLDVVENSAFTGDLLLFSPTDTPAARYYRRLFWQRAHADPAQVLVISNEWFGHANTFSKLATFPGFEQYLQVHYVEVLERRFPYENSRTYGDSPSAPARAYRIYILRGSPLLDRARDLGWRRPDLGGSSSADGGAVWQSSKPSR